MKRVIITGATGFLGSHLCVSFKNHGYDVHATLRDDNAPSTKMRRYDLEKISHIVHEHKVSLSDFEGVLDVIKNVNPDVIIHLASVVDVNRSNVMPRETFNASAVGLLNILESTRVLNLDPVVFNHSTDKVYTGNTSPYFESQSFFGGKIYEISKQAQDNVGQFYGKQFNKRVITIRSGNYFGCWDLDFNRIIPHANMSAYLNAPIVLRSNGKMKRDFLHVDDAVALHHLILRSQKSSIWGQAYNFSYGVNEEIISIIQKIQREHGSTVDVSLNSEIIPEIDDMCLSSEKSKLELSWEPIYTFDDALKTTCKEYSDIFDLHNINVPKE